ncbi:hypothetical protein ACR2XN_28940, partial [Klebsiella pneumoniae]
SERIDHELEELDENMAFLAKRFSTLKFRRSPAPYKPFKKDSQPNKNWVDKSKLNCYNCGIAGHLSTECRKPKVEKKERQAEPVDYKRKYFDRSIDQWCLCTSAFTFFFYTFGFYFFSLFLPLS